MSAEENPLDSIELNEDATRLLDAGRNRTEAALMAGQITLEELRGAPSPLPYVSSSVATSPRPQRKKPQRALTQRELRTRDVTQAALEHKPEPFK